MASVSELYSQLEVDPWRTRFSDDVTDVHRVVLAPSASDDVGESALNDWLGEHQPCLFGKIAAKQHLLKYCILTERLLTASDEQIRHAIQEARAGWYAEAFDGRSSGFVIVAVSKRLAFARPTATMAALAQRLCELYLLQEVPFDTIANDFICLEKPGRARRTWKWLVGVNFVGAQADMRWWHDHRIPGGMAFSMNSVGHMAKAGAINQAMRGLGQDIGEEAEDWDITHVESLEKALILAMRTIRLASEGDRPGTHLHRSSDRRPSLDCPVTLPKDLGHANHCDYFGYYHTDHTLPSAYFTDAIDRPGQSPVFEDLDFTYLFDRSLDDFMTMADGLRIRTDAEDGSTEDHFVKREKAVEIEISVDDEPLLLSALARSGRLQNSRTV